MKITILEKIDEEVSRVEFTDKNGDKWRGYIYKQPKEDKMKKKWNVVVSFAYSHDFEIEADTYEEADKIVEERIACEEIGVCNEPQYMGTQIEEIKR